jgi:predicted short-subunit dehydrogenase-like oxidoreductase (DUF2520 family)
VLKISIIGYGKLASLLVDRIQNIDTIQINQIVVRQPLSAKITLPFITKIEELSTDIDVLIVAVQDKHIATVADSIPFTHIPLVHTSGTVSSTALQRFNHYGVWYPVQSFGNYTVLDWHTLPVCMLASDESTKLLLRDFTNHLGCIGYDIAEHQRQYLHLAAVFANNFTNHMLLHAENILLEGGLDKSLLMPLIQQTLQNFKHVSPIHSQTGPAVRDDISTMEKHLKILHSLSMDDAATLYQAISDIISHSKA